MTELFVRPQILMTLACRNAPLESMKHQTHLRLCSTQAAKISCSVPFWREEFDKLISSHIETSIASRFEKRKEVSCPDRVILGPFMNLVRRNSHVREQPADIRRQVCARRPKVHEVTDCLDVAHGGFGNRRFFDLSSVKETSIEKTSIP